MIKILELPQRMRDNIVDRMIEETPPAILFRWIFRYESCDLDFRRRAGICACGEPGRRW